MQQMAGGVASVVAGMVVVQTADGSLEHFDWLGYIVVATTLLSLWLMYFIQRVVAQVTR